MEAVSVIPSDSGMNVRTITEFLRLLGNPAEENQIRNALGDTASIPEVVRLLRGRGLKADFKRVRLDRLACTPIPALAVMKGHYLRMVVRLSETHVLTFDAEQRRPALMVLDEFLQEWDGIFILSRRKARLQNSDGVFGIGWFFSVMNKYRGIIGEVLAGSLFLQIFALATPFAFQILVDKVLVNRGTSTLDVVIAGLVTLAFFEAVLGGLRTYLFSHTTNRVDVELGAKLFRHLMLLPLPYFQTRRVGDSIARVKELETIRQFLTGSALTLLMDLLFTFIFLGVMLTYSISLTLIVIASIPVYALVSLFATPLFRARLEEKFRRGAENQAFMVETLGGIETIKSMAVETRLQHRWEEKLAGYVEASQSVTSISTVATQTIQATGKLVTAGTLWLGAHEVISGTLTVGGLVAFNMFAGRVSQPVLRVAQMYQDFHQTRLSVERLGDILNTPVERSGGTGTALPSLKGAVTFEHVNFRHRADNPLVLEDISLCIKPGEIIGIVGPSGSGKSTLTKLLQRLYYPERGRILIDGLDISAMDASTLRQSIGVVLQDNVLFNMTIRENIAFCRPGLPMDQVIGVARLAGAHEFIAALPLGYETPVGERGGSLSGGQRQRLAIARTLASDPRILILDEATSALDYESERIVQTNLKLICKGRTVLIVAHRLSAVRHAHRIITLEKGRLVEEGSHEELVSRRGRYASLFAMQGGVDAVG